MQRPIASLLLLAATVAAAAAATAAPNAPSRTKYTTRFDNIDLDRILTSRRLVAHYVDCLLGRKRCPPEGAELKRVLPDALATRCARCSERQRDAAVRAIRLLRQRYPDLWAPLQAKWDPSGEHTRRLEQASARRAASAASAAPSSAAAARENSKSLAVRSSAVLSDSAASSATSAPTTRANVGFVTDAAVPTKKKPMAFSTTSAPAGLSTSYPSTAARLNPVSSEAPPATWVMSSHSAITSAGVSAVVGEAPKSSNEANSKENTNHLFTLFSSSANDAIPTVPPPAK